MSLGTRLCLLLVVVSLAVGVSPPLGATAAGTTQLAVTAPAAYAGQPTTVTMTLTDAAGAPIAGASIVLERRTDGAWKPAATVVTDGDGRATTPQRLARSSDDNAVRATYAGAPPDNDPATTVTTLPLLRRASTVTLSGPRRVVDERSVAMTVLWRTGGGDPIAGRAVVQLRRAGGWRAFTTVTTDSDGRATVRATPRRDTRWRVVARRLDWVEGDVSGTLAINNVPPGDPVKLPAAAPSPRRHLPAQAHAVGAGPHLTVSAIGDATWRQMVGRSWHRGCPVGRASLRLVRVNYWDYRGYRRRGELVANASAARAMGNALAAMYRHHLPIRAMYRVDRFGWSSRSRGGDDYASMAAGNTSAFNCRDVTGRPGRRSPHSWGRSLDVNTWENPYRSAQGIVPNRWWQPHSHPRVAWRSRSHLVVRLMAAHGLRWTYGNGDTQHFDYVGSHSRAAVPPRACRRYCD